MSGQLIGSRPLSGVLKDAFGNGVTNAHEDNIAAIDLFAHRLLRRERGLDTILEAAARTPCCATLQAYAAACHLLSDTRAGMVAAQAILDQARATAATATDRENLFLAALRAIAAERHDQAAVLFVDLAKAAPDDRLAAYVGHLHMLNCGRFDLMLAQARIVAAAHPDDPYSLGMLAFATGEEAPGEKGAAERALDIAQRAVSIDPSVAWVHHAAGHAFLDLGRAAAGVEWMRRHSRHWLTAGSSMLTHNWWHVQLLMLALDDTAQALAVYDALIAPEALGSVSSLVNAVSILARLERRGIAAGARWLPLAREAKSRVGEHVLPFIDAHYAFALGFAGDESAVRDLSRSAAHHAASLDPKAKRVWQRAGLPVLHAIGAATAGDWSTAERHFEAAAEFLPLLGGSSQQRGLFADYRRDARAARHVRSAAYAA